MSLIAAAELQELRKEICSGCPNRINHSILGNVCRVCGCVIRLKVIAEASTCPVGYW